MTTTLHIRIGTDDSFDGLIDRLGAIDADEEVPPEQAVLAVESAATLGRLLRPTNLEILQAVARHEPGSIRELARLLDRGPAEVLDNVNELEDYGLLRLEQEGRAKRPVVWYDELDVEVPLFDGAEPTEDEASA